MPAYCVVISCSSPCSMQIHFPEVIQINDTSGSDNIIAVYIGQTIPEAEMLKRLITSSLSNLLSEISFSSDTPSDHYPIFTNLNILPIPRPDPVSHSFRRISSINIDAFMQDLSSSELVLNSPFSLDDLLSSYNATLSALLDKHAPNLALTLTTLGIYFISSGLQIFPSTP